MREANSEQQPAGVDVYILPPSPYIRTYTDSAAAQFISTEQCGIWEHFAYIRDFFMPAKDFRMAENGAHEPEVFDTSEHKTGYAYMPASITE